MGSWVLVVTEDEHRRATVRAELEEVGFEVEAVPSVEDALAWLRVIRPAMVVVDPELGGVERLQLEGGSPPNGHSHVIPVLNLPQPVA